MADIATDESKPKQKKQGDNFYRKVHNKRTKLNAFFSFISFKSNGRLKFTATQPIEIEIRKCPSEPKKTRRKINCDQTKFDMKRKLASKINATKRERD